MKFLIVLLVLLTAGLALQEKKENYIRYYLFTERNPENYQEIHVGNESSLTESNFAKDHDTFFFCHGWNGGINNSIRRALFKNQDKKRNYFLVDWSVYGETINYISAKRNTLKAGKEIAEFIDWTHLKGGLSFKTLTVVGHSLGSHVAGIIGKNVTKGVINSIIGLDPAMPLFALDKPDSRLAISDAFYVETIQTNGGKNGFYNPIGKASFYANGGKNQPGCKYDINGNCAHARSVELYVDALENEDNNNFMVNKCSNLTEMEQFNCCTRDNRIRLGSSSNAGIAEGIYSLNTSSSKPFALGLDGINNGAGNNYIFKVLFSFIVLILILQ